MPKKKRVIVIECFFCGQDFKLEVNYYSMIGRVHCDNCRKKYFDAMFHKPIEYRDYLNYLKEIRSHYCQKEKDKIDTTLKMKKGRLFKGEIDLGKILGKDKSFFYVQKNPSSTISRYKRKFIKEF